VTLDDDDDGSDWKISMFVSMEKINSTNSPVKYQQIKKEGKFSEPITIKLFFFFALDPSRSLKSATVGCYVKREQRKKKQPMYVGEIIRIPRISKFPFTHDGTAEAVN
jgi:hypothetical protein